MCKVMQYQEMQKHKTSGIDYCQSVFRYMGRMVLYLFVSKPCMYSFAKWVISDLVLDYENIII